MKSADFWKNFRLGEEVHISGTFIYNGLRRFHELQHFESDDELFEFLYELSVGLERLLKIAIVLFEHCDDADQTQLEQSLITHSHTELTKRLQSHVDLHLAAPHHDLLSLLTKFYKTLRYDRFSLSSAHEGAKESKSIRSLLAKYLDESFKDAPTTFVTPNDDRCRRFMRRTVQKIAQSVYAAIEAQARALNIYTYELRYGSKAQSVFLRQVDIADEDVLWKELLVFFMNVEPSTKYLKFLKEIRPLGFDPGVLHDYLDCFKSDAAKAVVMDELEHHYTEMDNDIRRARLQCMAVIGAQGAFYWDEEDGAEQ